MRSLPRLLLFASALLAAPLSAQSPGVRAGIDSIFSRWTTSTPGCAVGVAQRGAVLLTKGYGMSSLEYGIALGEEAVLESGSVAKQFTSAALALLQLEGKLSLDDDIRRHVPEVPSFGGQTITIRHLLTHTSGLRDQWGLLSLTGNPPTTQVHTLALILHLVSRQQDLNFPVGSEYLYSNTGYALAAIIVQRVSGQSLAQFSKERFFAPMGMTKTQWRDDFQRIVPGRATAYQRQASGSYAQLMPFTNVYGNGGLLTTVGDMLKWNEALANGTIPGGKALITLLESRQRLTGGQTIAYALGLSHGSWQGHRHISHSGSTAGYATYLTRFPDDGVSIAVFCNTSDANPTGDAYQIASRLMPGSQAAATPIDADTAAMRAVAGRYRSPKTDELADFSVRASGLALRTPVGGGTASRISASTWRASSGATFSFSGTPGHRLVDVADADGVTERYTEVLPPNAESLRLQDYVGSYQSPELGVRYELAVQNGQLVLRFPPQSDERLTPWYADGFTGAGRSVRFVRNGAGRVTELQIFAGRVRRVRFERVGT